MKRDLGAARQAFRNKDINASLNAHSGTSIPAESQPHSCQPSLTSEVEKPKHNAEPHSKVGEYVKSMVYGGLDGLVSAFAVINAGESAYYNPSQVVGIGMASMIVEALSMGIGDCLSSKAENEFIREQRKRETWEVENNPEGEKREMVELYQGYGMDMKDASRITEILSKYKQPWVSVMMVEELGFTQEEDNYVCNGLVTFLSFIIFRTIPFLPYIVGLLLKVDSQEAFDDLFLLSVGVTLVMLFVLGVLKSRFSLNSWYKSGIETLGIGVVSAILGYFIGYFLA